MLIKFWQMKINKIKLENIRSYINQELEIPQGYTLLAGEIGSGKSTVLLATDFALFGLGSNITGASLLRNGENKGSVELDFDIDGSNIIIKRNLKRSGESITQDSGFVIIDGKRFDGSAIELKDQILTLLNYPKDLLTKSKSLIYRYTVYTPQEEMKNILLSNEDTRLETLRKVFGIDKYKRIRDNSKILIQDIKNRRKELAGKISDLEVKINKRKEIMKEINILNDEIKNLGKRASECKKSLDLVDGQIKISEEKLNELKELLKQKEIKELELEQISNQSRKNDLQIKGLNDEIKIISEDIKINKVVVDKENIIEKEKKLEKIKEEIANLSSLLGGLRNKVMTSEDIKEKISKLDICPICKQKVTPGHIKKVISEEEEKIRIANEKIKSDEWLLNDKKNEILKLQYEVDKFKEKISKLEYINLKESILADKRRQVENLKGENEKNKLNFEKITKLVNELSSKVIGFDENEKKHRELLLIRKRFDDEYRKIEVEISSVSSTVRGLTKQIDEVGLEIKNKEKDKEKLIYLSGIQNWFEDKFINLMDLIERKILFKIHNDFNLLFQKWFGMLIDNEIINVNLDESFTPLIEQNGHIIDYSYLSGGEKTAAALAYRLALNQVVNDLINLIKTKDLLILDEPTDGFSNNQLDRMKEVLDELNMNQVILVSHDSKIESFVENVIKLQKNEHVSEVLKTP